MPPRSPPTTGCQPRRSSNGSLACRRRTTSSVSWSRCARRSWGFGSMSVRVAFSAGGCRCGRRPPPILTPPTPARRDGPTYWWSSCARTATWSCQGSPLIRTRTASPGPADADEPTLGCMAGYTASRRGEATKAPLLSDAGPLTCSDLVSARRALGGTRTPNLLIRSEASTVHRRPSGSVEAALCASHPAVICRRRHRLLSPLLYGASYFPLLTTVGRPGARAVGSPLLALR